MSTIYTNSIKSYIPNSKTMESLSRQIALAILAHANPSEGFQIYLKGDLGTGKTTFVRSFLQEYGVQGKIKSPSYSLLESYTISNLEIHHFDFYRFSKPDEWINAGFRDLLNENSIILLEWPEKADGYLPNPDLSIHLEYFNSGRNATLIPKTMRGKKWLQAIALRIC
ncbi:MAG: tRNA (adenosine(37)-N6)-threonylcarbamoyltransferase complex ATPase subunit type 1 TsaE [Bordetella sp.]|nr:MAG: tRNA (adenosine(37)-N6)-threonylcarbamoyltransferase complex ATPase subunit type 1 TsaE [Bordetella sp.]